MQIANNSVSNLLYTVYMLLFRTALVTQGNYKLGVKYISRDHKLLLMIYQLVAVLSLMCYRIGD